MTLVPRSLRRLRQLAGSVVRGAERSAQPEQRYLRQLADAVTGSGTPHGGTLEYRDVDAAVSAAQRMRQEAALARAIARGEDLPAAVALAVRGLTDARDWDAWNTAWSLVEGVARIDGDDAAMAVGRALLFHARGQYLRAWRAARSVDDAVLARCMPVEAVGTALAAAAAGDADAAGRARTIAGLVTEAPAEIVVQIAGQMAAMGDPAWAGILGDRLLGGVPREMPVPQTRLWRWLAAQASAVKAGRRGPSEPAGPRGAIELGVLMALAPFPPRGTDEALEADLEALALVANLARFRDVTFAGDEDLTSLLRSLAHALAPQDRLDAAVQDAVRLTAVDRATARITPLAPGTWVLVHGDLGDRTYGTCPTLPLHSSARPIYVSLHLEDVDALDEATIAHLRSVGPIGCRDWTTVFVLLGAGVDAFFAGGIATTLDLLQDPRAPRTGAGRQTAVLDVPKRTAAGAGAVRLAKPGDADLDGPPGARLQHAWDRLAALRDRYGRLVTGRLQTALVASAIGLPTEFVAVPRGDGRWAGLPGAVHERDQRKAMADMLRGQLAAVLGAILAGQPEGSVYDLWREQTASLVAEARRRFDQPAASHDTGLDIAALVRTTVPGRRSFGPPRGEGHAGEPVTDIVIAFDQNLAWPAAVLLESVVANAGGPIAVWILSRGIGPAYQAWLGRAFPDTPITFIPCDGIAYDVGGPRRRIPRRITVSTMDRLLLAALLPEIDRVVYLDVDMLAFGDVCELGRMDLDGRPLAARDSNVSEASEWQRAGRGLDEAEALELRRSMARSHGFGGAALNAGLLVMDLDCMRRDDFMTRLLGFGERFGLHDQDTVLAYVGPDRAHLPDGWNAMPVIEDVESPRLVHWASFPKPWDEPLTYQQAAWHERARRLEGRIGVPPAG